MRIAWQDMATVPAGKRVFLLLRRGQKGDGELAVGMVFPGRGGAIDHWWSWGGPNAGTDDGEPPIAWAPLPDNWRDPIEAR